VNTAAIVETLAKEFSAEVGHAQRLFDLLAAGYQAPFLARFRRAEIGPFQEGAIRRFARRMKQLEELDRRRGTLLRTLDERKPGEGAAATERLRRSVETCMDRFELEDLFLPLRRPEPEVQLALDRGLGDLADVLCAPAPGGKRATDESVEDGGAESEPHSPDASPVFEAEAHPSAEDLAVAAEDAAPAIEEVAIATEAEPEPEPEPEPTPAPPPEPSGSPVHAPRIEFSPELARACAPFVNPDRGVHSEAQALEGAMRILSDRLGRSPALRGALRRMLRKNGRLSVRPLTDEKRLGAFRSLLKLQANLRQIQGHRLVALRQAQAARLVAPMITLDESLALPRVRSALCKHPRPEFESVLRVVAEQALRQRLLPMIEDDVRNELRERAEEEAARFLSQHLRQILLAPPAGARPVAGIHVDARGNLQIVVVDRAGTPLEPALEIEVGAKGPAELGAELAPLLASGVRDLVVGHGKGAREAVHKLRAALQATGSEACVFVAHEGGLTTYANSEGARAELPQWSAPAREAISLARRHQDPLFELLKADARYLGLGRELSLLSKANLRKVLHDTVESCVAHVGCDVGTAPLGVLRHVPGLSFDLAKKIVERRKERPFTSREELRGDGLLDDLSWTNAVGFLFVRESRELLDRTALHPEQYDLVRRVILEGGLSIEEALGARDATRGLRQPESGVDDLVWREMLREISHPGRDPRPRVFLPRLLPPDLDPKTLAKDQVVEGIVWNVTSFGAFVDLGIARDGMVHISEISDHYVRDARALLSVGQILRARVIDAQGQRVELSLKNVPEWRRTPPPATSERPHRRRREESEGREDRGRRGERAEPQQLMRAARSRRDGLVTGKGERKRGPGGGGRGRGDGRRGDRREDEGYDAEAVREATRSAGTYNPFATFFKQAPEAQRDTPA
jgi:uncharacterized protein